MLSSILFFALQNAAATSATDLTTAKVVSVETHALNQSTVTKSKALIDKQSDGPAVVTKTIAHLEADGSVSLNCETEHPKSEQWATEPQ